MLIDLETQIRQNKQRWNRRQIARKAKSRYLDIGKTATMCQCPKCDTRHETYMEWTGRGIPRIFCDACKALAAGFHDMGHHCGGSVMSGCAGSISAYKLD